MGKHSLTARHARKRHRAGAALPAAITQKMALAAAARIAETYLPQGEDEVLKASQVEAVPTLAMALLGLPELRGLLLLAPELRAVVLSGLTTAGAVIPRVTWERLGLPHAFDLVRMTEAARVWSFSATERDIEGAGAYIDDACRVVWPDGWELPPLPRVLQTTARASG